MPNFPFKMTAECW